MTTLTMPTAPGFASVNFGLRANSKKNSSPLDGTTQTIEFPGSAWSFSATITRMDRIQAAEWQAMFTQLRGLAGRFYVGDPAAKTPRGTALGTPLVNGASQTGNTLVTDGWTANQTGLLLPGDYFQVGTELKMVVTTATSNGAGASTITFEPPIRTAPADNAAIITANPVCIMRLEREDSVSWDIEPPVFYNLSFSAVESFV